MPVRAISEPALLRWGRETAGLTIEEAARQIQVKPDRLVSWEEGTAQPTINQLRRLAVRYRRPLSVFFLRQPPAEPPLDVHDYRRLPGEEAVGMSSALVLQLRRARERRNIALELLRDLEEALPRFDFRTSLRRNPEEVGLELRTALGVELAVQERWRDPYVALNEWRARAEAAGVLVFQASEVELEEMRGVSLVEENLPVVLFNSKDAPAGRVFTLLHELCHIGLRRSGICEPNELRRRPPEDQRVEVFCNHVAGAALVPMEALIGDEMVRAGEGPEWPEYVLGSLARRFGASKFVVLRRLLTAGRTSNAFYRAKHRQWVWELRTQTTSGGPPPHRRAVAESGRTFTRLVLRSYQEERITGSDVSKYLGLRLKHLPAVEEAVSG